MGIRAKMKVSHGERGRSGATINFSAVWEGSQELQGLSENAMFGNASPSGHLGLDGPEVPFEKFDRKDEYYVDVWDDGRDAGEYLISFPVRKVFQSAHQATSPGSPVQFRFAAMAVVTAMFSIGIANPHAIGWLDDKENLTMGLKLARGRRSDREIEIRKKMLEEFVQSSLKNKYFTDNPGQRDEMIARLERDIRLAEGADA